MSIHFNIPEAEFRSKARQTKAIIFDLDDTLLDSAKNISFRAMSAIRRLQARGIFISLCTARYYNVTHCYAEEIGIRGVYSAANGCQLIDGETEAILYSEPMAEQEAVRLAQYCTELNCPFNLSIGEDSFAGGSLDPDFMNKGSKYRKKLSVSGKTARLMTRLPSPEYLRGRPVYKIVVHGSGYYDELSRYVQANLPALQCIITSKDVINIFPSGCDKGVGVRRIAEHMNIACEQVCTFGDFSTDIPMFEAAGLSVAMGNAEKIVQERACAVTGTMDEDGVAEMLEAVFLAD